jgi:hypothetical protein
MGHAREVHQRTAPLTVKTKFTLDSCVRWGNSIYTPPPLKIAPPPEAADLLVHTHVWCIPASCVTYNENNKGAPSARLTGALSAPVAVIFFDHRTGNKYTPNIGMHQQIYCPGGANFFGGRYMLLPQRVIT